MRTMKEAGKEVVIGAGAFERSSVAWTDDGRIVVVADMGEKPELWFGEEPVRFGQIAMSVLVNGMEKNPLFADRCFLGRAVVNKSGQVFASFKAGTKKLDQQGAKNTTRGVALAAVYDGEDPEVVLALKDVGHGQADVEPGGTDVIVLGTAGRWVRFSETMQKLETGSFPAGDSGEKIQFRIARKRVNGAAVWHTVHNGCKEQASRYMRSGLPAPLTWADHGSYPDQGNDLNHPGLGVDAKKPMKATMGAVLQGALRINVCQDGKLVFDPKKLPAFYAATLETRHGPQFIPFPKPAGGMYCLFNVKGQVMGMDVEASVAMLGRGAIAQPLVKGRFASGAIRGDTLALVYARDGKLWKKEFKVSG
jgi:hypothetical protein